jgi:hypothetical protein
MLYFDVGCFYFGREGAGLWGRGEEGKRVKGEAKSVQTKGKKEEQEKHTKAKLMRPEGKQMEVEQGRTKETVEYESRKQSEEIEQLGNNEAVKEREYVEVGKIIK